MIPADAEAFLRRHGKRTYMYVRAEDGSARGWPMSAAYADGVFVMTTYRKSPKMAHIARAERMTLVVLGDEGAEPLEYVVAYGALRLSDIDASNAETVISRMRAGGLGDAGSNEHFRARLLEGKRVLLEVFPEQARLYTLDGEPKRTLQ
jgi:hypothetical protein